MWLQISITVLLRHVDRAQVRSEDTPILETPLVLPDGTTERRFVSLEGIELSVKRLPTATQKSSWAHVKRTGVHCRHRWLHTPPPSISL